MEDHALAKNIMVWITGSDHDNFHEVTGITAQKAWENLEEWERDDFIFCAGKIRELYTNGEE